MFVPLCFFLFSLCFAKDCYRGCKCTTRRADCYGVGVDPMSLNLKQDLLDYNFTGNTVGSMRKELYQQLDQLQYLILQRNQITEIEAGIFEHNPDLKEVDLSHNLLRSLPADLFQNNKKLSRFYCASNQLTEISKNFFAGLTLLEDVRLNDNQLVRIPTTAFVKSRMLHTLYLENNLLETAYWKWLSHFNHSKRFELYLDNNPWSCDCRMKDFRMNTRKWTTSQDPNDMNHRIDLPQCHFPDGSSPHVQKVDVKEFVCEKPKMTSHNNCSTTGKGSACTITFQKGAPGKVSCEGVGKPVPKVQLLKKSGMPVTKLVTGSVHYGWNYAVAADAGEYICVGHGFNETGQPVSITSSIVVVVESSTSPVLGIVLGLLFLGLIVMAAAFYYRYRYRQRAGYGSLSREPDTTVHYDRVTDASKPYPTKVTYLDDEDAVIEADVSNQRKDDEKEVLV